ncbi:uncharacterized protein ColSpa_12831 [Colletotrichum spaethianum]|uniref:Heterokaryon incompatibility domain-containing protein n=1 Tax=Colletotrichum spaethianum TaxID=700344 RepID=A0AA37UQJ9_9PEZI|nr:uncharacterized protein ColSpa_12831 [Colletotrichum spaethianum]GKT52650.1 hypothetical protein ColSpa_12831 [Colletotrichum spaethianum]
MGTIFGDALIVTIWLGNVLEEQRAGLELISDYILRSTNDKSATAAMEDLFCEDDDKQARTKLAVNAIDVLVQAPYWSRVWVIQEKCLGPFNPHILFGPLRFPLLSLHNFLEQAHRSHSLRLSVPTRASTWRILKLVELMLLVQERRQESWTSEGKQDTDLSRNEGDVEMLTLLLMLGRLGGAVDLRDKLYGLMGMMPEYIARYIEPDYNKPVRQVFSEFAHALIIGLGHFNFSLAGLSNTGLNIPSWVPDLTDTWDPSLWGTDCEASGGHRPIFRVEHHGLHLVAAGFQVDVIDGTAPHLGWGKSGELEVWNPAVQPSSAGADTIPDDFKTAIVRTLHRDTSWDCDTGTTVLDIPWLGSSPEVSTSRTEAMRQRGWGPVLQHAKYADLVKLCTRLDEYFQPWGRRFRSFFNNVDVEDNETLPQCRQPNAFVQSLDKHVGVVYPIITTEAGRFGTTIRPVLPGDAIFVILGCDGLVVLRPAEEVGAYQVISQCYVEGLMKGEAMARLARGEFTLRHVSLV